MTQRAIVLDANILIRAALGERVRRLIADHVGEVSFLHPTLPTSRHASTCRRCWRSAALTVLDALEVVVHPLDAEVYQPLQAQALARIGERDPNDWPALACALVLGCPVWTEDADFFGTGVATWTTSRVKLYLAPDA